MRFDLFDRRSAERFAELLDETDRNHRQDGRGPADDQFAELVAIGHSLSATPAGGQVDTEFRVGLRAMLVATAERDGIGATAPAVEPDPEAHAGVREPGRRLFRTGTGRRIRVRGAIVLSVAAGAMAVSGISAASENASPGDALYGVKRSTERAQLAMAGSDITRGQLSLDFARTRLAEAATMKGADTSFGAVLNDMDNDTRQGVRLLTGSAVTRQDATPLNAVDSFVTTQRATFAPMLGRLSAGNRDRALASMSLLDDVRQRANDLRTGLACDQIDPDGTDPLGPKLGGCATGKGSPTTDRSPGTAERQGSKSGGSAQPIGSALPSTVKVRPTSTTAPTAGPVASPTVVPPGAILITPEDDTSGSRTRSGRSPAPASDDGEKGVSGGYVNY